MPRGKLGCTATGGAFLLVNSERRSGAREGQDQACGRVDVVAMVGASASAWAGRVDRSRCHDGGSRVKEEGERVGDK